MLGIRYIRFEPTDYVMRYTGGKLVQEGAGLSFFYFAPNTSLVKVPVGSSEAPFIFSQVTADFQTVSVQGQVLYRIAQPKRIAGMMNFALAANGRDFLSDDPLKLTQRLMNLVQVLTQESLKKLDLRQALGHSDQLVVSLREGLRTAEMVSLLGIEILNVSITAIKPTPDTARALEAETRERILREADDAIYTRRNAAIEQERAIKENELNTEIAVENKKKQIKEAQMDAELSVEARKRELREARIAADISVEERNRDLVALSTANSRELAEARAYGIEALMKAVSQTDPRTLQALTQAGMKPDHLVAQAFRELAEGAGKIGQLNISPDLLRELLNRGDTE